MSKSNFVYYIDLGFWTPRTAAREITVYNIGLPVPFRRIFFAEYKSHATLTLAWLYL